MELRPSTKNRLSDTKNYLISFQYVLYYNKLYKQSISKQHYSQIAGSVTKNVTKLSFASERMQAAECSQFRSRLLTSNGFIRRRGVAMSITISISAVQTHTPDTDADEMSNSRHLPSLIPDSVGVDLPCSQKPHGSLGSFSLTGIIFVSIPSHFACIQLSRPQYFTSSNHLLCGFFISTF